MLRPLIYRLQKPRRRQVLVSTHSDSLLNDPGISGDEILLLFPGRDGTTAQLANDMADVKALLAAGIPPGDVVLSKTRAPSSSQLGLFDE